MYGSIVEEYSVGASGLEVLAGLPGLVDGTVPGLP